MTTHNASIYHCISCGRVVHAEPEAEPPECCGHTMAKPCEETIQEGDGVGEKTGGHSETPPQVIKGNKKPR
jgi:hypothetical protein